MNKDTDLHIIRAAVQGASHPKAPDSRIFQPTSVIALFMPGEELKLLFIQKADVQGYPWAGQMAFPGGHVEKNDPSTKQTALRELEEEMGINRKNVAVIGSIGHFQTINNKDIEAWVGVWNKTETIQFDPDEISRVFEIPLAYLIDVHKNKGYNTFSHPPNIMSLEYPFEDVVIWGVTAKIVYHLIETLLNAV